MKLRHRCRASAARADLRKRKMCRGGLERAAPRAADVQRCDLRCRGGRDMSADDERCPAHGGKARGVRPSVRHVREVPRHHSHVCDQCHQQAPQDPHQAEAAYHADLRDVRQGPGFPAYVQPEVRLQGAQAQAGHGRAAAEAQGNPRAAGGPAQAGGSRPAGAGAGAEGSVAQASGPAAPAGRRARAWDLREPRLPAVWLQGVLRGHGELPATTWRLTWALST